MSNPAPYKLEKLVYQRLMTELFDLNLLIGTASEIGTMPKQFPQAVFVIPQQLEISEQRRNQVALRESVMVVGVQRNAATQITGEASREEISPILVRVIGALLGWVPGSGYEALTMVNAANSEHEAGFGYYPLAFETRYVLTGVS